MKVTTNGRMIVVRQLANAEPRLREGSMRPMNMSAVITAALALAVASSGPAGAGQPCNRLGLSANCVTSTDVAPTISLKKANRDGRLRVWNKSGELAVTLKGHNANVTNLFSNVEKESNGLVKAWARINDDGTVFACWRCNTDTNETHKVSDGFYEVDFTPLSTDISGRPMSGVVEGGLGMLVLNNNFGDLSTVFVSTFFLSGVDDRSFTLIVY